MGPLHKKSPLQENVDKNLKKRKLPKAKPVGMKVVCNVVTCRTKFKVRPGEDTLNTHFVTAAGRFFPKCPTCGTIQPWPGEAKSTVTEYVEVDGKRFEKETPGDWKVKVTARISPESVPALVAENEKLHARVKELESFHNSTGKVIEKMAEAMESDRAVMEMRMNLLIQQNALGIRTAAWYLRRQLAMRRAAYAISEEAGRAVTEAGNAVPEKEGDAKAYTTKSVQLPESQGHGEFSVAVAGK